MSDGRTIWRAKDAAWHDREWIVVLVEKFGPAGYAVIDYLENVAKLQNDGGRVKAGPRGVARATGADVDVVSHVLSRAVTLGLLDEYEDHEGRFTCRVTWFVADQGKAMAANRKAKQRASDPVEPDDPPSVSRSVPDGPGQSRSVTECPPTGQDSTEDTSSLRSEVARKRVTRRVDQTIPPEGFPVELLPVVDAVLVTLHRAWDHRGGIEPMVRGVALGILRNPRADHAAVALKLEHWLTSGNGRGAQCKDICARFGDWVEGEGAAQSSSLRVIEGGQERAPALRSADAWRTGYEGAS